MATKSKVEVVKVTHEQLKRRAEASRKGAVDRGNSDGTGGKEQLLGSEKGEKPHTKSRPTKARKEKEQRKPDQQLYRPGKSRIVRNSSSAGSDPNSSLDESPTKPIQTPVVSKDAVGSRGDQGLSVREGSPQKESPKPENSDHQIGPSSSKGHAVSDRIRRDRDRNNRVNGRDDGRKSQAKPGSKPRDNQGPLSQRQPRDKNVRQESSKRPRKTQSVDDENDETWEIKPEDWEADTTSTTTKSADKDSTAQITKKGMHGRNNREAMEKPLQGRGRNESPPKQSHGHSQNKSPPKQTQGRSKGSSRNDARYKDRKDEDFDKSIRSEEKKPHDVPSLMGNDWDREFEQQYQSQHSPKKSADFHHKDSVKQNKSNQSSEQSNRRQDHGGRTENKNLSDIQQKEPKKDLVKSSRQNYASEIQKLRAKKEQMEKESSGVPGALDLQITVRTGAKKDEDARVVEEKSSKSYSAGRSRQRVESGNPPRQETKDADHNLSVPSKWEDDVEDLNFHVESMVITNQKFKHTNFDGKGRHERQYGVRRQPPQTDDRFYDKDQDDWEFEGRQDERRVPSDIEHSQFSSHGYDDREYEKDIYHDDRSHRYKDDRYEGDDHGDRVYERFPNERRRPPDRDDNVPNRDRDKRDSQRHPNDRRPPKEDRSHDKIDNERGSQQHHNERKKLPHRGEESHDHPRSQTRTRSTQEQKDQRSEMRYKEKEESHHTGKERPESTSERNNRQRTDSSGSNRSGNERLENRRGTRDENYKEDRHQHGRKPERHSRDEEDRRRYNSGGRKDTKRRDRVSVSSDDGSERQSRRRGSSEVDESSTKHGGGILRIPGKPEEDSPQTQHASYTPVYDQYYRPPESKSNAPVVAEEPKSKPKGRGDQSRLWDPSKPDQKPALDQHQSKQSELQFHDPDADLKTSRQEGGTPPAPQQDNWSSYATNYPPGFGPMMQPQYGYPPPPPGYPMPNPSQWPTPSHADANQGFKSGRPPHPPPHMMQYPPTYPGHPGYPVPPGVPYHPGFGNPHMMQEHHPVNRQSAQKLLRDAARCEAELFNSLSLGIATKEMLRQLLDKQKDLEQLYEGIILLDLDLCNQYNVEQTLWKNSYYQLIEGLRKAIQEQPNGESYKEDLLDFMQHGTTFYEGLLNKLQSTYHFQLDNRTGLDPLREEPRRSIKLALLSSQRCMIALGDIARYKEQANDTNNYGKARSWYMKAQHLAPRNGRPYNQLAILALYTRHKLDAVYYYVRSLAATNPFLTARESLMTLFEEVRRKVAHKEQEEMAERREMERRREQRRKRRRRPSQDENRGRKEIWVSQDGRRVGGDRMGDDEEEEEDLERGENLARLSAPELNKKFVLSFLNVHGKLFTKTGMEAFDHATDKLLREFKALLDHTPSAILSTRLIQLMAINMFAVTNTTPQGESPSIPESRPLILEQAIQLGLNMFALLCMRCCSLLQDHLNQQNIDQSVLSQDLHELLPGVKVYADWMMCHPKLWNPPPSCNTTSYSASLDVWSAVAEFLNLVKRVAAPDVKFAVNGEEDSLEVLLPEDLTLSGFVPLMALPLQPVFIQADTSKILANDRVRLDSLTTFGEYLSGQETPIICFSVKTDGYVSVAPKALPRREAGHSNLMSQDSERVDDEDDDDVIVMDSYIEDEAPPGDGTISRLRERRDSLEKQIRDREMRDAHIQAIVESHRSQRVLEIVIKPYFLIPDTNCFIDHLPAIQRLVTCQRYLMVVPLVVINELDGLAQGSREGQFSDPHHAVKVQQGARHAVGYLEEEFANRNRYLCAMTSKGNTMDTIRFRSEEAEWRGNNDDLILRCCMHYCVDDARHYMPTDKDAPLQIEREVVLLTDDRNLRVKAIQQNVPVKDIILFIRWTKV